MGLALLDRDDPRRVIRRATDWVFGPNEPYEFAGDVSNVVFSCGMVADAHSEQLRLYYGAADTRIGLATADITELLDWLRMSGG